MNDLDQLYQQIILDHSKRRHGEGTLEDPDGESFQVNPTCGDQVTVQVRIHEDQIAEIAWQGKGCSISQASISVMHQMTENKTIAEFEELREVFAELMNSRGQGLDDAQMDVLEDASAFVGVSQFPARIKCALLGWMALHDATLQARGKDNND